MSEPANLRTGLAERIRARIVEGALAPGARINESQLSLEFGVSRTPLREALMALRADRAADVDAAARIFVTPLSTREIRELYAIGRVLDRLALESAGPVPAETIAAMERINARFAAAKDRPDEAWSLDRAFHRSLTDRSPNRRLLRMIEDVQAAMERYERLYMSDSRGIERSVRQHGEIIAALRGDDLDAAIDVFARQWDDSVAHLLRALGEQP